MAYLRHAAVTAQYEVPKITILVKSGAARDFRTRRYRVEKTSEAFFLNTNTNTTTNTTKMNTYTKKQAQIKELYRKESLFGFSKQWRKMIFLTQFLNCDE